MSDRQGDFASKSPPKTTASAPMTSAPELETEKSPTNATRHISAKRRSISFGSRLRSNIEGIFSGKKPSDNSNERPRTVEEGDEESNSEGDMVGSMDEGGKPGTATQRRQPGSGDSKANTNIRTLQRRPVSSFQRRQPTVNVDRAEPEIHVIGQISAFSGTLNNAFCSYDIVQGNSWENVAELEFSHGQTQVDYGKHGLAVWNHPIEGHFFCNSIQGWPRIYFEVFALDVYGGRHHHGYSICFLPTTAGHHTIDCGVWRPTGNPNEEVSSFFLGINPQLRSLGLLYDKAQDERCKLFTVSVGTIHLEFDIIMRNFEYHQLAWH